MVFHHEPSMLLVEELCHMTCCQGVIDLTCGSGVWALHCMEGRIPYFGVTLSSIHMDDLRTHLVKQALAANIKHADTNMVQTWSTFFQSWSIMGQHGPTHVKHGQT